MNKLVTTHDDGTVHERALVAIDITSSDKCYDTYVMCIADQAVDTARQLYLMTCDLNPSIVVKTESADGATYMFTEGKQITFVGTKRVETPLL